MERLGSAVTSGPTDDRSEPDLRAPRHRDLRQVRVRRAHSPTVIDRHGEVVDDSSRERDDPGADRSDGSGRLRRHVDTPVSGEATDRREGVDHGIGAWRYEAVATREEGDEGNGDRHGTSRQRCRVTVSDGRSGAEGLVIEVGPKGVHDGAT